MNPGQLAHEAVNVHGAMQVPDELGELGHIILDELYAPHTVLELGSRTGGTLWFFSQLAAHDATLISLDRDQSRNRMRGGEHQRVRKLQIDSGDHTNYSWMRYASIDLLFIDGDHALTAVERDYRMYSPLVRRGGLIAFHDIGFPCAELWARIRGDGLWSEEYIYPEPGYPHPLGIGVICAR